jgi:hypothetical protein
MSCSYPEEELDCSRRFFERLRGLSGAAESLDNCTPSDVRSGRHNQVLSERDKIKKLTMKRREKKYRAATTA